MFFKSYLEDVRILLRNVPGVFLALFFVSVILMNLLANKELVNYEYIALDCGFLVSWFAFLCMDVLCKHFGAKAAVKISVAALIFNLFVCGLFHLVSMIPGNWGEYYTTSETIVNDALNRTIGGSWYIVFGSSLAMLASSVANSVINHLIGKRLLKDNFKSFMARSYISTVLAQCVDNFVFAIVVSYVLFGWSWMQIVNCSLISAVLELLCEVLFSPIGYRVSKNWKKENVGAEYFKYVEKKEQISENMDGMMLSKGMSA